MLLKLSTSKLPQYTKGLVLLFVFCLNRANRNEPISPLSILDIIGLSGEPNGAFDV
tara:strand:- start:128 stop:295 length:168 start_codon:yes stop_codon:yes gene_type:complete